MTPSVGYEDMKLNLDNTDITTRMWPICCWCCCSLSCWMWRLWSGQQRSCCVHIGRMLGRMGLRSKSTVCRL